jgi:hypothetical protein
MTKNANHKHNAVYVEGSWFCLNCHIELAIETAKRTKVGGQ